MRKTAAFIYLNAYSENIFYGGGAKVNFYIIKGLIQKGFDVDVYCKKSNVDKSEILNNLFVIEENFDEAVENLQQKYDIVLSVNLNHAAHITYVHDHTYIEQSQKVRSPFERFLYKIFCFARHNKKMRRHNKYKSKVKDIGKIVVSSQELYDDYIKNMEIPSQKMYILPPGVDLPLNQNNISKTQKEKVFGISAKGIRNKGGYLVLGAVNKLKKKYDNFKVVIINQNACNNLIVQFLLNFYNIRKYVEFIPLQDNMDQFYSSIDFLIMPSFRESYGMVTSEAMAYKKPAIVSSVSGAKDLIVDGQNGYIVDFSSARVDHLAAVMEKAINLEDEKYLVMSQCAYNTVCDMSWESFSAKYIQILEGSYSKS